MATEEVSTVEAHDEVLAGMATKEFTDELIALLRIRSPLIYVTCNEEKRLLTYFKHLSAAKGYDIKMWDCNRGLLDLRNEKKAKAATDDIKDNEVILQKIIEAAETDEQNEKVFKTNGIAGNVYLLLDYHRFLKDALPSVERLLKRFCSIESMTTIIIVAPYLEFTPTIENLFHTLDFPFPNRTEIGKSINALVGAVQDRLKPMGKDLAKDTKSREDELIQAAQGLTLDEATSAFAKSIVQHHGFDIKSITGAKRQIIARKEILEYCTPSVSMKDVGGLQNMIKWFERRKLAFSTKAREYGLITPPNGVLLLGFPGCGKSLSAKAIASLYEMPLLRLDFGRLFNSFVGESERAARLALKTAAAVAPCILWLDEVEKGVSGLKSSGSTDGGTTSRVVSTFLTWMQEKTEPVFVIATANDHKQMASEFMRRFDEVFFVDLPTRSERVQIWEVLLRRYKREPAKFDVETLAMMSDKYTGNEIEKVIKEALYLGLSEKCRVIKTEDMLNIMTTFRPIAEMRQEEFAELKEWAKERCKMANTQEEEAEEKTPEKLAAKKGANIDLSK